MIALRRAILMKADPAVSLHAHRLFSSRACSCKKDPYYKKQFSSLTEKSTRKNLCWQFYGVLSLSEKYYACIVFK